MVELTDKMRLLPREIDEAARPLAHEALAEAATAYLGRGWSFLPLAGKRPALPQWKELQSRLPTTEEVAAWFGSPSAAITGIGIVTGKISSLIVVDCDTPEDADYWQTEFPTSSLAVQTGGGGAHFYYLAPDEIDVWNRVKLHRRRIDVRGEGGYVAAPPSIHPNGRHYTWLDPSVDLHQPLTTFDPAWLLDKNEPVACIQQSLPSSPMRHVVAYIRRIEAISGEGGHNATFRAACKLRDAGLSADDAFVVLQEWNAVNAHPPWSEQELLHKVNSAFGGRTR
jgi:hypothetical protein